MTKKPTVFITGTSSGIGKATVELFLRKGWQVAATMRNISVPIEFSNLKDVKLYQLDVTNSEMVNEVAKKVWEDHHGIEAVINNAGYGAIGPLEGATEEQIAKQMDTNFMGSVRVMKAFIPFFREKRSGVFVNVSSIAGRIGMPLYNIYHASKFALEGLTESLYYELRPFGVRVKLVEPGPVKTEFNGRSREDLTINEQTGYSDIVSKVNTLYGDFFEKGDLPETTAKTIYKAVNSKGSRLRFPSGILAKFLMVTNKILPGNWLRVITSKIAGIKSEI
ncbi:SDR family oxidoreductase [Natronoflexus pectinivorans]|uniref:Short-subunit dehydrogenase n=1 Tax=Natronoflexus pectinivorans TaxID=682526 RepID=A0A4R2GH43_9BACT|nr:SDR family oxidoreductase [Natronoflexus pectinivorans]TCO07411.1 short-subunit dehydrogenase [Natronoflexus pectinivorans]